MLLERFIIWSHLSMHFTGQGEIRMILPFSLFIHLYFPFQQNKIVLFLQASLFLSQSFCFSLSCFLCCSCSQTLPFLLVIFVLLSFKTQWIFFSQPRIFEVSLSAVISLPSIIVPVAKPFPPFSSSLFYLLSKHDVSFPPSFTFSQLSRIALLSFHCYLFKSFFPSSSSSLFSLVYQNTADVFLLASHFLGYFSIISHPFTFALVPKHFPSSFSSSLFSFHSSIILPSTKNTTVILLSFTFSHSFRFLSLPPFFPSVSLIYLFLPSTKIRHVFSSTLTFSYSLRFLSLPPFFPSPLSSLILPFTKIQPSSFKPSHFLIHFSL